MNDRHEGIKAVLAAGMAIAVGAAVAQSDPLAERFANPPAECALQAWWHWVGDCVTEEGIDRDLAAMAEMEIGVAHIFAPNMANLPKNAPMLSPEWMRLFAHAVQEAKKHGIKIGFHNCPGWSESGGPWITPDNSMKVVVASESDVPAGAHDIALAQPQTNRGFYCDIAVQAFPVPETPPVKSVMLDFPGDGAAFASGSKPLCLPLAQKGGGPFTVTHEFARPFLPRATVFRFVEGNIDTAVTVETSPDGKTWRKAAGFEFHFFFVMPRAPKLVALSVPAPVRFVRTTFRAAQVPVWQGGRPFNRSLASIAFQTAPMTADVDLKSSALRTMRYYPPSDPSEQGMALRDVVDLTGRMRPDGTLGWTAPDCGAGRCWRILRIGYTSTGKECAPATLRGLECDKLSRRGLDAHWPNMPAKLLSVPGAKDVVRFVVVDSYEAGGQNWTESFPDEFRRRRGYDIRPWLPLFAGYTMETSGKSARTLYDIQKTVSDLFSENYYGYFAELCHRSGVEAVLEPYGGPFEHLRCAAHADVPTGEFWLGTANRYHGLRLVSSAGHVNGRRCIAAESFTTEAKEGRWQITPAELRRAGDRAWLEGVNQIVFHSYLHQPFTNARPGLSLGRHGTQLNVNTTWWSDGVHWSRYVRRGQFLLQSGEPRAQLLMVANADDPNSLPYPRELVEAGYDFDWCLESDLSRLRVVDGRLRMPNGAAYDALHLGAGAVSSDKTLGDVRRLVAAGARVAGGEGLVEGVRAAISPLAAARSFGLRPDADSGGRLRARRRTVGGRDVYFVMNCGGKPFSGRIDFAAHGAPERWDAASGRTYRLPAASVSEGRVAVDIDLPPDGSAFVVFGGCAAEPWPVMDGEAVLDLSEGWRLGGFCGAAAPEGEMALAGLKSWSESDNPRLRHFAGRAVYRRSFSLEPEKGRRYVLDLGDVRELANVRLNGRPLGCLWEPPFRMDVTAALANGANELEVEAVNTWPNRLIGDAAARKGDASEPLSPKGPWPLWVLEGKPDSGTGIYTWSNWLDGWHADDALLPAGLLGPVRILSPSAK